MQAETEFICWFRVGHSFVCLNKSNIRSSEPKERKAVATPQSVTVTRRHWITYCSQKLVLILTSQITVVFGCSRLYLIHFPWGRWQRSGQKCSTGMSSLTRRLLPAWRSVHAHRITEHLRLQVSQHGFPAADTTLPPLTVLVTPLLTDPEYLTPAS